MRRLTLDSNVLVYAALEPQSAKGRRAADLIAAAAPFGILAAQALGEFVNVIRRRAPDLVELAIDEVEALRALYVIAPTGARTVAAASTLALRHRLQFWDAVIWTAAVEAGASVFLSEDLQDRFAVDGMTVVNPFAERNAGLIDDMLRI